MLTILQGHDVYRDTLGEMSSKERSLYRIKCMNMCPDCHMVSSSTILTKEDYHHTYVCMAWLIRFFILQNIKTCPGTHQASYLVGNMNYFLGSKSTSVWSSSYSSTLPYAFMALACTGTTLPLPSQNCTLPISFPHTLQTKFVLKIFK